MTDVPTTDLAPQRHLTLWTADLYHRLLTVLDEASERGVLDRDELVQRFSFLESIGGDLAELAQARLDDQRSVDFVALAEELEDDMAAEPPLARVRDAFGDRLAADLIVAAATAERDGRIGALYSILQVASDAGRPCIGLLALLYGRESSEIAAMAAQLAAGGFVLLEHSDDLRDEQTIRVPPAVLHALEGSHDPGGGVELHSSEPDLQSLVLPDDVIQRLHRAATLAKYGAVQAIVLRGSTGTGRRSALAAMAGRAGRRLLVAPHGADLAPAVAVLTGSWLAWTTEPGLGELQVVQRPSVTPVLGVITGTRGAVRVEHADNVAVIDLPRPGPLGRRELWTRVGLPAADETLEDISARYLLTGGMIETIAGRAAAIAAIDGRPLVEVDDVRKAGQDIGRQRLEALADLLPAVPDELGPVLRGSTEAGLQALVLRCTHRERLGAAIGGSVASQITTGVRALLSGPSGTGKTLAARWLGTELRLDVYRADLASLVDKYIGETERRLDELFTRAEELDVLLLIDEGDALMTQRTDVRSSTDRYANLETDYLLQRLEAYRGIVLITTNAPHLVDTAFRRRLDVSITFGPPGPAERREIWRQHLPVNHQVDPVQLTTFADECRLTGGQIRNAAIHAALLALDAGRPVDTDIVRRSIEREFALAGRSSPLATPAATMSPYQVARART